MLGLVSYKKKYKNTSAYRNLELQELRKYYDEVLAPKVDAAFAEMREYWNRNMMLESLDNLDWMLDTNQINLGENDGR